MAGVLGALTPLLYLAIIIAPIVHILIDRHKGRLTPGRSLELFLFWQLGLGGVATIVTGIGHIAPGHEEIADRIGFAQSPFQWEVGFADIAVGVLMVLAAWKRGDFIVPAITAFAIMYIGDAVGHVMEWLRHDNTEPYNIYTIPTDILQPVALIVFYLLLRRKHPELLEAQSERPADGTTSAAALRIG